LGFSQISLAFLGCCTSQMPNGFQGFVADKGNLV